MMRGKGVRGPAAASAFLWVAAATWGPAEEVGTLRADTRENPAVTFGSEIRRIRWEPGSTRGGALAQSTSGLRTLFAEVEYLNFYLRVGAVEWKDDGPGSPREGGLDEFEDDGRFSFGFGFRSELFTSERCRLLGVSRFTRYDDFEAKSSLPDGRGTDRLEIRNHSSVIIALPVETVVEGIRLYAGPLLYVEWAEMALTRSRPDGTTRFKTRIEEESDWVGGVAGASIPLRSLSGQASLNLEGQYRSRPGFGISLTWVF